MCGWNNATSALDIAIVYIIGGWSKRHMVTIYVGCTNLRVPLGCASGASRR